MEKKASSHACLHHGFRGREIEKLLGDSQVHTFRRIYGVGFAPGFCASHVLRNVLPLLDTPSLDKLLIDSKNGQLESKLALALAQEGVSDNEPSIGSETQQPI
jgi:hypothetical protein